MRSRHLATCSGFSLVELLVVIAVVALLASLILPGLSRAREYAYFTTCKSNLKQIVVGFLCSAANNRGRMPEGEWICPDDEAPDVARRIGGYGPRWMGRSSGSGRGKSLLDKVYDNSSGQRWDGTPDTGWQGKPRLPGTYLPLDILWDPITIVRDWGPFGHSNPLGNAGTERERDELSRRWGDFGYEFFVHTTGCNQAQLDLSKGHRLSGVEPPGTSGCHKRDTEEPYRPATRSRSMTTSHEPSVWVGVCCCPATRWFNMNRDFVGHFGVRSTPPGVFRFNVVHLDGHVHNAIWKEYKAKRSTNWLVQRSQHANERYACPYLWGWKGGDGWLGSDNGIEPLPNFSGRFDENR
jgi:prepilin-type N-terminal cleavage/methylation domain-containing protein